MPIVQGERYSAIHWAAALPQLHGSAGDPLGIYMHLEQMQVGPRQPVLSRSVVPANGIIFTQLEEDQA